MTEATRQSFVQCLKEVLDLVSTQSLEGESELIPILRIWRVLLRSEVLVACEEGQ